MIRKLCNFMFATHTVCENKIHELAMDNARSENEVYLRDRTILTLSSQIQELKAINNFQTWELEKKIAELEEKYKICKCEVEVLERDLIN